MSPLFFSSPPFPVSYLFHGSYQLAHKAFSQAQAADPGYVQAWVGQALVAETIGNAEAMDLFRHACDLQYHVREAYL